MNSKIIETDFEKAKKWLAGYTESNWWGSTTHQSRTDYFLAHLSTQWNLGTAMPVTINKGVTDLPDSVTVNGIRLSAGVFDGSLFADADQFEGLAEGGVAVVDLLGKFVCVFAVPVTADDYKFLAAPTAD